MRARYHRGRLERRFLSLLQPCVGYLPNDIETPEDSGLKCSVDVPEDFVSRVLMIQASVIEDPFRKYTPGFKGTSNLVFKVWKVERTWIGRQLRYVCFLNSKKNGLIMQK